MKTTYRFDWGNGYTKARRLSRSFKTLKEAQAFAADKRVTDIYKANGMYKVEWTKVYDNNK